MKKITKKLFGLIMAAMFIVTLFPAVSKDKQADAATSGIVQTNATTTSVTIKWSTEKNATKYYIGYGTDSDAAYDMAMAKKIAVSKSTTSYTIKNLKAGKTYWVTILYSRSGSTVLGYHYGAYVKTVSGKTSAFRLQNITLPITSDGKASFTVNWKDNPAADGFQYEVYTAGGTKLITANSSYESLSYNEAKQNQCYKVRVRSYVDCNGTKKYSAWSGHYYVIMQPRLTKAIVNSKGALSLQWNKISGADQYEIWVSTDNTNGMTGYKKLVTTTGTSRSIATIDGKTKFSKNKYYYVTIRAVKKVGSSKVYSTTQYYNIID